MYSSWVTCSSFLHSCHLFSRLIRSLRLNFCVFVQGETGLRGPPGLRGEPGRDGLKGERVCCPFSWEYLCQLVLMNGLWLFPFDTVFMCIDSLHLLCKLSFFPLQGDSGAVGPMGLPGPPGTCPATCLDGVSSPKKHRRQAKHHHHHRRHHHHSRPDFEGTNEDGPTEWTKSPRLIKKRESQESLDIILS